jgi:hypothetical protein
VIRLHGAALLVLVTSAASCAVGGRNPDDWFPVSPDAILARAEAARAIEICGVCPVREHCLDLSLQNWSFGQYGVWGGLVAAERDALRRRTRQPPASGLEPEAVKLKRGLPG